MNRTTRSLAAAAVALLIGGTAQAALQARAQAAGGHFEQALSLVQEVLGRQPQDADARLLKAELLQARGAPRTAVEEAFEQVLDVAPGHIAAHGALVASAIAAGDEAAMRLRLRALHKRWPQHPQTLMLAARTALRQGKLGDARDALQQLLRSTPDDARALHLAGEVESRAGARLPALTHLKKALASAPKATPVLLLLARVQLQGGEAEQALATLAPLLAEAPGGKTSTAGRIAAESMAAPADPLARPEEAAAQPASASGEAMRLAAQAQLQLGRMAEAQALLARAAVAQPGDPRFRTAEALALLQRDGARGLAALETLAASDDSGTADLALIHARILRRDFTAALQALARAEARQPQNATLPLIRGQVHERLGDPKAARAAYEQAQRTAPDHLGAAQALAERDLADGQPKAALARLQTMVQAQPGDARRMLALAQLQQRMQAKPAEVQASIEAATRAAPTDLTPVLALVRHHLGQGRSEAALTVARSALVTFAAETELIDLLGQAQLASGEPQQALGSFRKVVSARPRQPLPLLSLARAQRAVGERAAARATLQQALTLAPGLLEAHRVLLEMALEDKQWPAALQIARDQQRRQAERPEGWMWEGAVAAAQRRWPDAASAFRTALAKGAGSDAAQKLYSALRAAGEADKADKADRHAADWLNLHPLDLAFHLHLGDAVARADPDSAEAHYRRALALQPAHPRVLNNLAWVVLQQRKPGAAALAERANQAASGQPELMDTWAAALAAEAQGPMALDLQKQAVALAPKRHDLRLRLARLAVQEGDKTLARDELARLQALGSRFAGQGEVSALLEALR